MKLEINRNLVSGEADIETVKALVRDFPPQNEVMLTLWKNDDEYLQAAGVPANGFRLTYANRLTGRELVSTNQKLRQRTVMVTFDHFVADNPNWRNDVGWKPAHEQAAAVERRMGWKRGLPVIVAFAFFALAFAPFAVVTRIVADDLFYKPLCAQTNRDVSHFTHSSGGDLIGLSGTSYSPPTCWYADGSSVPLGGIVGDGRAALYDTLLVAAEVVIPAAIIVALLVVIYRAYDARRKPQMA